MTSRQKPPLPFAEEVAWEPLSPTRVGAHTWARLLKGEAASSHAVSMRDEPDAFVHALGMISF